MKQTVLFGILALCCLVIPLLSLGGAGMLMGFLQQNPGISLSGLLLIIVGIILYLRRRI